MVLAVLFVLVFILLYMAMKENRAQRQEIQTLKYEQEMKEAVWTIPGGDDPCPDCGITDIFGRHRSECSWWDEKNL